MFDRIRQCAQEIKIVNDKPVSVYTIRSIEEICRFLIISYHDAFFLKSLGYSSVQNTERLTEGLSTLVENYKESSVWLKRGLIKVGQYNEIIKNRAEFTAYHLIATACSIDGLQDMLSFASQQKKE